MKRIRGFGVVLTIVTLAALIAACGTPTAKVATSTVPAAKVSETITLATISDAFLIRAAVPGWEQLTGNKVVVVDLPAGNLAEKLYTELPAKTGAYDVVFMNSPDLPYFAQNGFLASLTDMGYTPDSDFVKRALEDAMWPPPIGPRLPGVSKDATPELYGLPSLGNVLLFWYRKDILTAQDVSTLDNFIAAIKAKADPANGLYGLALRGQRGDPVEVDWEPWLYAYGGKVFDDDWNIAFDSPEGVAALNALLDLMPLAPPGAANFGSDEAGSAMLNGSALAALIWPPYNAKIDDPTQSKVGGKIGITTFPKGRSDTGSVLGIYHLCIPADSKHKEAALDFIKYATSAEAQKMMLLTEGMSPTRTSVFDDPEAIAKAWWLPGQKQALATGLFRARTPDMAKIEDILGLQLNRALLGEVTAQQALDQAAVDLRAELERSGYYK